MSKYPCIYCDDKLHCTKDTGPNDYKPFCGLGPCPYKTPSNADRIRSMSDKELAEWFRSVCSPDNSCIGCKFDHIQMACTFDEWLKEEAK